MRAAKITTFLGAMLFAAPAFAQADNLKIVDCLVASATPYTFNPGQAALVQCDTQGRLILSPQAASSTPTNTNVAQFGGSNVVTGLGPSGSGIPRVTVSTDSQFQANGFYNGSTIPSLPGAGSSAIILDKRSQIKASETGSDDPLVGITPVNAYGVSADNAKGSQGNLYYAMAGNSTSTLGYVIEYDAAATPTGGTTLTNSLVRGCHLLPASGVWEPARNPGPPKAFANGIQILLSSTSCFGSTIVYTTSTAVTGFIEADVR